MQKVRPAIFATALAATALSLGGCATEDYVDKHVAAVDTKVQTTQGQLDQHQVHLTQLDQATQDAMNRAQAAGKLAEEGASVEVVDLRTLLPLDRETVSESVRKTSKVLLLHEDTRTGGMAGELAASIIESVFEYLDGPIVRVTAPDTPVPYSPPLEDAFLPNAEKVVEKARWLFRY